MIAVTSCKSGPDTFTVNDPDALARLAVLQLDGDEQALARDGRRFSTTRKIRRDADGRIRVLYVDGGHVDCPIGYATPGMAQHWNFQITLTGCEME
jgi:hypothetical protein